MTRAEIADGHLESAGVAVERARTSTGQLRLASLQQARRLLNLVEELDWVAKADGKGGPGGALEFEGGDKPMELLEGGRSYESPSGDA